MAEVRPPHSPRQRTPDMLRSFTSRSIGIVLTVVAACAIQACAPATTDIGGHEQQPPDATPPTISSVVAASHTCALTSAGAAYCWGYDVEHAGLDQSVLNPTLVSPPAGVAFQSISVSKVEDVTCALAATGAAYCWG